MLNHATFLIKVCWADRFQIIHLSFFCLQNTFVRLGEGSPTPTEQDDGFENEDMGAENEDEPFPDGDIYLADDEDSDYDPSTQPVSTFNVL